MPTSEPSDAEIYEAEINALVTRYREVPPPWARFPRVHPLDIHWRMGAGEDYKYLFAAWAASLGWDTKERVAYLRRWDPPCSWLDWVAWFLWPEEMGDCEEPTDHHFAEMERLGFGSRADWLRCSDVSPEAYPLAENTSKGWLSAEEFRRTGR